MVQNQSNQEKSSLNRVDPVWSQLKSEAEELVKNEPALASFVYTTVLQHKCLEDVIVHRLVQRLDHPDVDACSLMGIFRQFLEEKPELSSAFRADLAAVYDRDPACSRLIEPLLYFKGFHALQTYRFSHGLWHAGRTDFAYYLQSQSSKVFSTDIHPAAQIGQGIMFDHATAIVIGETAVVGDNSSILHGVTLGGSGKEAGDRHPKIGTGVMIGAGAKILGNISIGNCSRVAAGSVVLKDIPACKTVAGIPAKVVGEAGCDEPSRFMDQHVSISQDS